MNRRGLRVTLTAGAIGLAVVAFVVAFNWQVVRDHVEAWRFQATHETVTLQPGSIEPVYLGAWKFRNLAERHAMAVTVDASLDNQGGADLTIEAMRECGYRIVEQLFPRRAYVVTGYPTWTDVQHISR